MENVLKTVGPTKSVLTDFANVSLVMLELLKEYVAHMYQLQEDAHQAQSGCLVNANPQHCVVWTSIGVVVDALASMDITKLMENAFQLSPLLYVQHTQLQMVLIVFVNLDTSQLQLAYVINVQKILIGMDTDVQEEMDNAMKDGYGIRRKDTAFLM